MIDDETPPAADAVDEAPIAEPAGAATDDAEAAADLREGVEPAATATDDDASATELADGAEPAEPAEPAEAAEPAQVAEPGDHLPAAPEEDLAPAEPGAPTESPAPAEEPRGPAEDAPAPTEFPAPSEQLPPPAGGLLAPEDDTRPRTAVPAEPASPVASTEPVTVGFMIAEALRRAGVRWAFTVPGESFLGLLDGLRAVGINVVATRHEGAAAFMAEAHAQLTGRPAAALGTRAVGAANLAIGIHTAAADSSPMFALVGQVDTASRGREAFQEVDLVSTIGGLARFAAEPNTPEEAVEAMGEAVAAASAARPGPVLLALREDLLDATLPPGTTAAGARHPAARPSDEQVRDVLQLLASAERPVILAGAGVLRARTSNDLLRLAELLRVPVIASWRRGDVISNEHPLYLGMAGYGAPSVVRERLERADALLVVGSRLGEVTSYAWTIPAPGTRWAHVDVEPVRPHPDLRPADLVVEADARLFLRAAVARLETRGVLLASIADARAETNASDRRAWEEATAVDVHPWSGPGVHPGRVIRTLRSVLPDDAIVATDAGNFAGWAARGFRFRRPGTFLGPTSGAMGYGLPAAIAAGLVHRDRAVVALVGDGGLGMTLAEIETAVRAGLRTVVVVFDNEQYGMIRAHQDRRPGGAVVATDLGPIDFAAVARAMGARGVRVETDAAFEPALRQALASDRPTVIHLIVDRRWVNVDSRP